MKKSIIAICGAALAAVAFAQGPVCGGKGCQGPRRPGMQERERPVMLFVCDKTDDAAVEAYKQAVLAKIDEAVAKSREQNVPTKLVFIAGDKPHRMRGPRPSFPPTEEAPAPEAPAPEAE